MLWHVFVCCSLLTYLVLLTWKFKETSVALSALLTLGDWLQPSRMPQTHFRAMH